jgi:hypothetical protein
VDKLCLPAPPTGTKTEEADMMCYQNRTPLGAIDTRHFKRDGGGLAAADAERRGGGVVRIVSDRDDANGATARASAMGAKAPA